MNGEEMIHFSNDPAQRTLEEKVKEAISRPSAAEAISTARDWADRILRDNPSKTAEIVQIELEAFGNALPPAIQSCRLSIMRGGSEYPVERHPNADQFVYSLENSGTISSFDGERWLTKKVSSDPKRPLVCRLHRVPANVWHQPIPGDRNWVVLGFHTVPSDELEDDFGFGDPNRRG